MGNFYTYKNVKKINSHKLVTNEEVFCYISFKNLLSSQIKVFQKFLSTKIYLKL